MADFPWVRTLQFQVDVPAETTSASPLVTDCAIGPNVYLKRLVLTVPAGHVGLTGFALVYADEFVLPFQPDTFLILDGVTLTFEFDFPVWGSEIQIHATNADIIEHTFLAVFQVEDVELRGSGRPERIPGAVLEGGSF